MADESARGGEPSATEVAKRALGQFDGTDLKPLFEDDAVWPRIEEYLREHIDPDCRFRWLALGEAGVEHHGLDGFREGWLDWFEPWAEYRSRTEDFMEMDDGRALVLARQTARSADGTEIEMHAAAVCEVQGGLITAVDFHASREDALALARRSGG